MTINIVTGVEIKDKTDFTNALDDYITNFRGEVKKALYKECQNMMSASAKQCPVDKGKLRASRRVIMPKEESNGDVYVDLVYGTNYAIYVHENLEARHRPPTKAKFLEDPVRAAMPMLVEKIIERVNKIHTKAQGGSIE